MLFNKVVFFLKAIYSLYKFDKINNWLLKKLKSLKYDSKDSSGIILTQLVRDYNYILKIGFASNILAKKHNLSVKCYDVEINYKPNSVFTILNNIIGFFIKNKYEKICYPFFGEPIFSVNSSFKDKNFIREELNIIVTSLDKNKPQQINNIKFQDTLVGDLIYDSYLRFFNKPTIKEIDTNVIKTIEIALNIYYNFKSFLKLNNVKILLNTYTSYLNHGILARICLDNNIPTYTLGATNYVTQLLSSDFPFHGINHSLFSTKKNISKKQLDIARDIFQSRFEGKIDGATSYMRKSAYFKGNIDEKLKNIFNNGKRNIVVYTHDFFDSPHINRKLYFPDLFLFLKEVLENLTDVINTNVFIKTHPNGINNNKQITIDLVNSFKAPNFHIIDESVSNLNIVELKPDLVCTARGTIGVEMAYFGIPVVAIYDNIYVNFKFVDSCLTKERYFSIIKGDEDPIIDFDKNMIYSFYYQAYIEKADIKGKNIFTNSKLFHGDSNSKEYLDFLKINNYEFFKNESLKVFSNFINKKI